MTPGPRTSTLGVAVRAVEPSSVALHPNTRSKGYNLRVQHLHLLKRHPMSASKIIITIRLTRNLNPQLLHDLVTTFQVTSQHADFVLERQLLCTPLSICSRREEISDWTEATFFWRSGTSPPFVAPKAAQELLFKLYLLLPQRNTRLKQLAPFLEDSIHPSLETYHCHIMRNELAIQLRG